MSKIFLQYLQNFYDKIRVKEIRDGKIGTFTGVFLPGILSVFGVITFLRLPQILGESGPYYFSIILSLGILINLLTSFSISSTVTNSNLKSGGVYTLLSRCFGAELGIAVSLPLYFSQVINIAFCVIGLLEISTPFVPNEYRLIFGISFLLLIVCLSFLPSKAVIVFQIFVLIGLFVAFYFVMNSLDCKIESKPNITLKKSFWQIFAAFFPAITGFESGLFSLNQVRSVKRSFPLGTIATVLVSFFIYFSFSIFICNHIDAKQLLLQDKILLKLIEPKWALLQALISSTVLYALCCMLNGPKLLQAMAKDDLLPNFIWKKIQGPKEFLIATIASCLLAVFFFMFFDLDLLAPLLTHFFLLSYAMINLACFIEAFIQNPSWRPSFFVHYGYPLAGFLISFCVMLMIDPGLTFLSWFFVIMIYLIMRLKRFSQNFDDVRQSILLYLTRFAAYRLISFKEPSLRSWRPQVICFSQNLTQMTPIMKLAKALTQDKGFLIVASALKKDLEEKIPQIKRMVREFFSRNQVDAIIELVTGKSIDLLVEQMITSYGLGPIKPNTMLFSYALDRGSEHHFDVWMKEVESGGKNGLILCYREKIEIQEFKQFLFYKKIKQKEIEIVLENETKLEQYFLFVLAALLQRSDDFFQAIVTVVIITENEEAINSIKENYEDFFVDKRFNFQIEVKLKNQIKPSQKDLVIMSYVDFEKQIQFLGNLTLLVHQCEKLAFDHLLD